MSPLGFEVTRDVEDEVRAHPDRVPASLQTPAWRDRLTAALAEGKVGERHGALVTFGAWDVDPIVAAALRPFLTSEDMLEVGLAASGLARQGDITDLPGVLAAAHGLSPAQGGTADAMLPPLRAALELARLAGPEIVAGVKARARGWRDTPAQRRRQWDGQADDLLDALLAD